MKLNRHTSAGRNRIPHSLELAVIFMLTLAVFHFMKNLWQPAEQHDNSTQPEQSEKAEQKSNFVTIKLPASEQNTPQIADQNKINITGKVSDFTGAPVSGTRVNAGFISAKEEERYPGSSSTDDLLNINLQNSQNAETDQDGSYTISLTYNLEETVNSVIYVYTLSFEGEHKTGTDGILTYSPPLTFTPVKFYIPNEKTLIVNFTPLPTAEIAVAVEFTAYSTPESKEKLSLSDQILSQSFGSSYIFNPKVEITPADELCRWVFFGVLGHKSGFSCQLQEKYSTKIAVPINTRLKITCTNSGYPDVTKIVEPLAGGEHRILKFIMEPASWSFSGLCIDENGRPIKNVLVVLEQEGLSAVHTKTNEQGRFALSKILNKQIKKLWMKIEYLSEKPGSIKFHTFTFSDINLSRKEPFILDKSQSDGGGEFGISTESH
ncbi:MAG: carboxypeptidase regulatory-like domain-containing protein [Planctomycetes bacterium]|nr:carboxypeptidase regulatory-like domain-containing protein [Planctomycetota bacterium]